MKWLVTIPRYLPEKVGGNFTYVHQFTENLVALGDDVHIVTTTRSKELPSLEVINSVTIHRVYVEKGNMGPLWFNYTNRVTNYIRNLDNIENFDCINPHSAFMVNTSKLRDELFEVYTLHAVVTYEYAFKIKKILQSDVKLKHKLKTLLSSLIALPLSFIREWVNVNRANKIVVMSKYVKGTIQSYLPGIDIEKVEISRIGIDDTFMPPKNKELVKKKLEMDSVISLLTVRRLESRMGVENLIQAIRILKSMNKLKGVKLYIAGKGSLSDKYKDLITKLELTDYIELLGFVSDEELRERYQASDAFVMPTEELEGFGIVTIEAFASGIPVIATPAGANEEVAGKYCSELLAKSKKSPSDLAKVIEKFLNNSDEYIQKDYSVDAKGYYNWKQIILEIKKTINSSIEK